MSERNPLKRLIDEELPRDERGFSEYDKAFGDTVVLRAAQSAAEMEKMINQSPIELSQEELKFHQSELDTAVSHALGATVEVTGSVQFAAEGDESEYVEARGFTGIFNGFVVSRREGMIHYDYLFRTTTLDGEFVSPERAQEIVQYNPEANFETVTVQARPQEVLLDFRSMHPIRARAFLELAYPNVLREIDSRIISEDVSDTRALLALRGFQLSAHDFSLSDTQESQLVEAVEGYLRGMIALDMELPYAVSLEGTPEIIDGYDAPVDLKQALMLAGSLRLSADTQEESAKADAERVYTVWIDGELFSDQTDAPAMYINTPIDTFVRMRSVRELFLRSDEDSSEL